LLESSMVYGQAYDDVTIRFKTQRVAKMDIEPNNNLVNMILTSPVEAGAPVQGITNTSKWLNYSCCLKLTDSDRYITVAIASGSVPAGLRLSVTASAYTGLGDGTTGTSSGTIILSGTAQTIISGIRGAYTGNGVNNGHQLNYELEIINYNQLDFNNSTTINLEFTIVD